MLQCICVLLLAASALSHLDEATLDNQWESWKITHRREYNGLVSLCQCVLCMKGLTNTLIPEKKLFVAHHNHNNI